MTWRADLAITNINVVNPWAEISPNMNPIEHIWEHPIGQLVMSELEASAIRQCFSWCSHSGGTGSDVCMYKTEKIKEKAISCL